MNAWTVIILAGIGSYALRMSMISNDRWRLPSRWDSAAELVGPAAFAALAATSIATLAIEAAADAGGGRAVLTTLPIGLAVAAAALAVVRTGRPYLAVVAGMPTYWLTTFLLP